MLYYQLFTVCMPSICIVHGNVRLGRLFLFPVSGMLDVFYAIYKAVLTALVCNKSLV